MSIRSIALSLAAACVLAVPATAAETKQTVSKGVQYKDLDLATEAGQKELEQRIDSAARDVCGMDETRTGSRIGSKEARECYRDARQQIGDQLSRATGRQVAGG